jgi:MerR family redox-sensitive transcriptional activator SoxR
MADDLLSITRIAERSGFAPSALRFYERAGLIHAERSVGGRRRYRRSVLRRLAFIRAARHVGLTLDEIREQLASLPENRTPTRADWSAISAGWRERLDGEIEALTALRDGLTSCIGCGCLSLERCTASNPGDIARRYGPGAAYLPRRLRDPLARP